jgi:hypothetical protein
MKNFLLNVVGSVKQKAAETYHTSINVAREILHRIPDNQINDQEVLEMTIIKNLDTGETTTLNHANDISDPHHSKPTRSSSLHTLNFQYLFKNDTEEQQVIEKQYTTMFIHGIERSGRSTVFQFLRIMEKSEPIIGDHNKVKDSIFQTFARGMFDIVKTSLKEGCSLKNVGAANRFIAKWEALLNVKENEAAVLTEMYREDFPTMKNFLLEPSIREMIETANDNNLGIHITPNLNYYVAVLDRLAPIHTDIYARDALRAVRSAFVRNIEIEFKQEKFRMIDFSDRDEKDDLLMVHTSHDILLFCIPLADLNFLKASLARFSTLVQNIHCQFVLVGTQFDVLKRLLVRYNPYSIKKVLYGYNGAVDAKSITEYIFNMFKNEFRGYREGELISSYIFNIHDISWGKFILCKDVFDARRTGFYDIVLNFQ